MVLSGKFIRYIRVDEPARCRNGHAVDALLSYRQFPERVGLNFQTVPDPAFPANNVARPGCQLNKYSCIYTYQCAHARSNSLPHPGQQMNILSSFIPVIVSFRSVRMTVNLRRTTGTSERGRAQWSSSVDPGQVPTERAAAGGYLGRQIAD